MKKHIDKKTKTSSPAGPPIEIIAFAPSKEEIIPRMIDAMDSVATREVYPYAIILGTESYKELVSIIEENKEPRIQHFGFIRHPYPYSFFGVTLVCDPSHKHYVCALPPPPVILQGNLKHPWQNDDLG